MPYPEFALRCEAAALKQLGLVAAFNLAQADPASSHLPILALKDAAGV